MMAMGDARVNAPAWSRACCTVCVSSCGSSCLIHPIRLLPNVEFGPSASHPPIISSVERAAGRSDSSRVRRLPCRVAARPMRGGSPLRGRLLVWTGAGVPPRLCGVCGVCGVRGVVGSMPVARGDFAGIAADTAALSMVSDRFRVACRGTGGRVYVLIRLSAGIGAPVDSSAVSHSICVCCAMMSSLDMPIERM